MQHEVNAILLGTITYTCILKACAMIGAVERGILNHGIIVRQGVAVEQFCVVQCSCGHVCQVQCCFKGTTSA